MIPRMIGGLKSTGAQTFERPLPLTAGHVLTWNDPSAAGEHTIGRKPHGASGCLRRAPLCELALSALATLTRARPRS
jgi:hypothetical protein